MASVYLRTLDFTIYWQVESLVSISIATIATPPSFCVTPIQGLSCLDNGLGLPTLKTF